MNDDTQWRVQAIAAAPAAPRSDLLPGLLWNALEATHALVKKLRDECDQRLLAIHRLQEVDREKNVRIGRIYQERDAAERQVGELQREVKRLQRGRSRGKR